MCAVGEEALEPRFGFRYRIGPCDAGDVEAAFARAFDQGGLDVRRMCQKSRSA